MVSLAPRTHCAAMFGLLAAVSLRAQEPTSHRIGDTISDDILTPVPLQVMNPEATVEFRQKQGLRVPAICRYETGAAEETERRLGEAFDRTRGAFLQAVTVTFQRPVLSRETTALAEFRQLVASFPIAEGKFPLTTNLAVEWATTASGEAVKESLAARLREAMQRPIQPDAAPDGFQLGPELRLVAAAKPGETFTVEDAEQRGMVLMQSNVITLTRARAELENGFPAEESGVARFVASLLRPNCVPEIELTRQARGRLTDPIFAADLYSAGQAIARRGQIVDAKIKAALDQLATAVAVDRLQQRIGDAKAVMARTQARNRWLVAGLASVTLVLLLVLLQLARQRQRVSLLPARLAGEGGNTAVVSCPSCQETIVLPASQVAAVVASAEAWRQRALAAEARADHANAAIRSGALVQFARLAKDRFIGGLLRHRRQLLDAQQTATEEMSQFERRLDELQAPLKERLHVYEQRIAELEEAIAAKGEENRQLIEAKIQTTRKQMETERLRSSVELNWVVAHPKS